MPALVQYGLEARSVELRELDAPTPAAGEVLVKVAATGLCGSEIHQYHATQSWRVNVPVILGHEFSGTVAEVGTEVGGFTPGDRVVSETAARICGACVYCRTGAYNLCPQRLGFGYGVDGGMAGFVSVPARCLHHIPDTLDLTMAALAEPVCVAYNAVSERTDLKPGQTVLVIGPGPIGLLCAALARLHGATEVVVAGLTRDAARLDLGLQIGATRTLDLQAVSLADLGPGAGLGFDVVIDAAGAAGAFQTAMEAVRPQGQITKVGWGPGPLNATLDPLVAKAVTVRGSFSHTYNTWERVIALLSAGAIDVRTLIGLDVPISSWQEAFEQMASGQVAKAVIRPWGSG
jgi:L-iditol 2-dehydrogenase